MNVKLKILNIYSLLRAMVYDKVTQKKCAVSLGDLMLRRAEMSYGQFMAISRYMDIKAYCEEGDASFKYLNAISYAQYGEKHGVSSSASNRAFQKLIDSYKKNGYIESSLLTVDKFCNMIDGTHRIGANLYFGYDLLNANMVKRTSRSGLWQTIDQYFRIPLPSNIIEEIDKSYSDIQDWLCKTGNTFGCLLKGEYENEKVSLVSDMRMLSKVLNILPMSTSAGQGGILIQFSLNVPDYKVKDGKLFSEKAAKIEQLLMKRKQMFNLNVDITVSKSCVEGKELWKQSIKE